MVISTNEIGEKLALSDYSSNAVSFEFSLTGVSC